MECVCLWCVFSCSHCLLLVIVSAGSQRGRGGPATVDDRETADRLKAWYPDLEDVEELLEALVEHLRYVLGGSQR